MSPAKDQTWPAWSKGKNTNHETTISFPGPCSPWPAVRKRELWEHPFQAYAIDTIDADCAQRSATGWAEFRYFLFFKMDNPRALVFRPLVKGNEALEMRLMRPLYLQKNMDIVMDIFIADK